MRTCGGGRRLNWRPAAAYLLASDGDRWRCRFSVVASAACCISSIHERPRRPHQTVALTSSDSGDSVCSSSATWPSVRLAADDRPWRRGLSVRRHYSTAATAPAPLLLFFGRSFEVVGIDIADLSLSRRSTPSSMVCRASLPSTTRWRSDRNTDGSIVTWNAVQFHSRRKRTRSIGGGDLGIELCMQFIDTLPPLKPRRAWHVTAVSRAEQRVSARASVARRAAAASCCVPGHPVDVGDVRSCGTRQHRIAIRGADGAAVAQESSRVEQGGSSWTWCARRCTTAGSSRQDGNIVTARNETPASSRSIASACFR